MKAMRFSLFLLGLSLFVVGCSKKPVDHTKSFQGSWRGVDRAKKIAKEVIFDKDQVQLVHMKGTQENGGQIQIESMERCTFSVDNSKSPAEIDFISLDGENQGKVRPGIFTLENETLTLCIGELNSARPTDFSV